MKKFISLVLALVMALSLTTVAWGAIDSQANLEAAIPSGGEVILDTDITLSSTLIITNGVTLNLNGKTITGEVEINTTDAVVIKNGNITNAAAGGAGRCIDTRVNANVTIDGVNLTTTGSGNTQPLTIGGSTNGTTIVLKNSTITASSSGYAIINFVKTNLTIQNCNNISGYAAIYMKPGSNGSVVNIEKSTLVSNGIAGASNSFSTVVTEDDNVTFNVDKDSTLTATAADAATTQAIFGLGTAGVAPTVSGVDINVADDATLNGTILAANESSVAASTVTVPAEYADELVADGFVVAVDANGQIVAAGVSAPAPVGGATVTAKSYKLTSNGTLMVGNVNATFSAAVAATLNDDGKQTNTADISHYTFEGMNCVVTTSLADADIVLYSDAAGKNVMMYLKVTVTSYDGTGTVYTNFGKSCGQVTYTAEAGKTYYTTNADGDAGIYVADKEGTKALMVGGKLVLVKAAPVAYTTAAVKHAAVPTVKDGKVIGYTCATCKLAAIEAPNYMSIPKGADIVVGNWYWPVAAASTPSTDKVTSAETFDAGIAMYVGMSVMAAAGSAVVLKKKD